MEKPMTRMEMKEQMIKQYLNDCVVALEEEKVRFVERFNSSPSHAIEWNSNDIVMAECQARLAEMTLAVAEEQGLLEACQKTLSKIKEDLVSLYGGGSTNPYSNANEKFKNEAQSRFYRRMVMMVDRLAEEVEKEQEKEERKQNVTDTTVYAMRSQYGLLLGQLGHSMNDAREAKTQRDRLAAEKVGVALQQSIKNLQSLAEDLGVELVELP